MVLCEIKVFESGNPGPNLVILGGVHGNEPCGVEAIRALNINPLKGKVTCIIANLEALRKKVRFINSDLNRAFTFSKNDKESMVALEIKEYLDQADALLDLHSSFSKVSFPFVICEKQSLNLAKCLPVKFIVTNIDKFHQGSTDEYMNKQGKIAVCVECGNNDDTDATIRAKESIVDFCNFFEVIERKNSVKKELNKMVFKVTGNYIAKKYFYPSQMLSDFANVKKNELLGVDGEDEIKITHDSYILFMTEAKKGKEAFLKLKKIESKLYKSWGNSIKNEITNC